jgi:hypothetical protein
MAGRQLTLDLFSDPPSRRLVASSVMDDAKKSSISSVMDDAKKSSISRRF